jgi:hypothetical protein
VSQFDCGGERLACGKGRHENGKGEDGKMEEGMRWNEIWWSDMVKGVDRKGKKATNGHVCSTEQRMCNVTKRSEEEKQNKGLREKNATECEDVKQNRRDSRCAERKSKHT